jgi:hypothetical protein
LANTISKGVAKGIGFFTRQERDWKVSVVRTNTSQFLYRMVLPYLSVYIMALGANGTQLGIINSVGMGVAAIVGPFGGYFVEESASRKFTLSVL